MSDEKKRFSFDWGAGGTSEPQGIAMDTNKSSLSPDPSSAGTAEAGAHIEAVRAKRGRPSRDSAESVAQREKIREQLAQEFATLFAPEYWEGIVRGPADLMMHVSGRELWNVPDKEIKPLATGAAHTARLFLQTDPKWIALIMFSVSLTQVYGARIALHMSALKKEARERRDKEQRGTTSATTPIPFERDKGGVRP